MAASEEDPAVALLSSFPFSDSDDDSERRRRRICFERCGRPWSVCICPYLPPHPIPTTTTILLLHHPHSLHNNTTLSTLPPLSLSLLNLHLLPGRRLHLHSHPLLLDSSLFHTPSPSALFLFPSLPSSSSLPISAFAHHPPKLLIVFDGTWTQAREMVTASLPFLNKFAAHVSIGECDEGREGMSSGESELVVRKEPFMGCVSTMEAVARALRVLEGGGKGEEVEERLLGVLRAMVGFQRRNVREVKTRVRVRMRKKKEINKLMKEMQGNEECLEGV